MNHESQDWERLFEQLPFDTSAHPDQQQELRTRVLHAYDNNVATPSSVGRLKHMGHLLMKYKAPHWTVAAMLVAGIVWLVYSGGTTAFALEEVVENLTNARTARFDMTVRVTGQPEQTMKAYYLRPSHFRQELANGYVNITDWAAGKMIGLDPQSKQATVINLSHVSDDARHRSQMNQFELTRDLLRIAIDDPNIEVESLGEQRLDSRRTIGFRLCTQTQPMTVWVDPETKFPVQIETTMVGPPETHIMMSHYEFNIELDESLFDVAVPQGYEMVETDLDTSPPTEEDFITAMRLGSKISGGKFPPGVDLVAIAAYVGSSLARQGISADNKPTSTQMQDVMQIGRGIQFATTLPQEADAHYAGETVTDGEKDRPLFWYKPAGSQTYRVIYGDLSVKESEDAPDVAGARRVSP